MNDQQDIRPDAFLSYTRTDDEYYGGAITSLRKFLELGVKVVTGLHEFNIFQDKDGIELGQRFKKRLDEAVADAWFFIPIITPLFFNSPWCRDELQKFIAHEKSLDRDDLILPIYYVTAPVLEKADLRAKDSLATEISERQRYDWRTQADLPINDPRIRPAVTELAEKIAAAIERTKKPPVVRQQVQEQVRIDLSIDKSPVFGPLLNQISRERAFREASETVRSEEPAKQTRGKPRAILWVDDHPDNNIFERQALEAYNIRFELAKSTGEALAKLADTKFDAIISDMGRWPDPHAGYTLLKALRSSQNSTPYFIFAASSSPTQAQEARSRGAQGSTNRSEELIADVLACLGAKSDPAE